MCGVHHFSTKYDVLSFYRYLCVYVLCHVSKKIKKLIKTKYCSSNIAEKEQF